MRPTDEPYLLISADTHAGPSRASYRQYLDAGWREAFDESRGGPQDPSAHRYSVRERRSWDHELRSTDQSGQGVVGEVVYPNTVPPFFDGGVIGARPPAPERFEPMLAGVRAYNRWLVDFCAQDPARYAGIGVFLPNDLDEAINDIEFIAESGLRGGVLLPVIPPDCGWLDPLFHPAWDRVFAAIQDHDLVMNQHAGQGRPGYGEGKTATALWYTESTFYGRSGWRHLLFSGAFEKFPRLKLALAEFAGSWLKSEVAHMDAAFHGVDESFSRHDWRPDDEWDLRAPPSSYAYRNCFYGASFPSRQVLEAIDDRDEDQILWGDDYPHAEGTFPYTVEALRLTLAPVPEERRRKILGLNAARLYRFDLESLGARAREWGPTPAEVESPLPASELPRDSSCALFNAARAGSGDRPVPASPVGARSRRA